MFVRLTTPELIQCKQDLSHCACNHEHPELFTYLYSNNCILKMYEEIINSDIANKRDKEISEEGKQLFSEAADDTNVSPFYAENNKLKPSCDYDENEWTIRLCASLNKWSDIRVRLTDLFKGSCH